MPRTTSQPTKDRTQLAATAAGIISENFGLAAAGQASAPTSQVVWGWLLGLRAGDVVTGLQVRLVVAAAGTAPTTARFGLADSTGKIVALSGNVGAAASWVAGPSAFAFTTSYTVPADGGYYGCFVVNGVWGTTQPTVVLCQALTGATSTAFGSSAPPGFKWTAQTDLPGVGSSLTLTTGTTFPFYVAAY